MQKNDFYFSLSQAATATGKSKSIISKALQSGQLSYIEKTESGYKIEPSELFRVFPKKEHKNTEKEQNRTLENIQKNAVLEKEIEYLKIALQEKERTIETLQADKEFFKSELSKTSNLLSDMREKASGSHTEKQKGFWATLLRKNT
jgi:response regulator RpfG family c-di-GMP phosphodiesterase